MLVKRNFYADFQADFSETAERRTDLLRIHVLNTGLPVNVRTLLGEIFHR